MTEVVVVLLIGSLIASMILIIAVERGPSPSDLAIAYELAWDRLDYATIWSLSAPSIRNGRTRRQFITGKQSEYAQSVYPNNRAASASVHEVEISGEVAVAITSVSLIPDPGAPRASAAQKQNEIRMARRMGRWEVTTYLLHAPKA